MAPFLTVPADLFDNPKSKTAHLSPGARRLYATSWAICDDQGQVHEPLLSQAISRWGDHITREDRLSLEEILYDMQNLGFLRDLRVRRRVFEFKRSGNWLS